MDWMESQHLVGNHAVRIDLLSKANGIKSAEEYFDSLPGPSQNHQTYGALLSCYCSKKLNDKAVSIYNKMKDLGLATGVLPYNNLMSLHLKLGHPKEVQRLFHEMKASNTCPDTCSHKILFTSYAMLNDIDSIERIAEEIEQNEGAWHWSMYCHLAAIYNSAKLFENAKVSLKKAELMMNNHDSSPFPFLISLYAGAGDLLEVKRMWSLLKVRILKARFPTNKEYLVMLHALVKLDDIGSMRMIFEEWESIFGSYETKLLNAVMEAYLERDMVEEAKLVLEKAIGKGARLVLKSYWLFIYYYLKKNEGDEARKWSLEASLLVKRG